MKIVFGLIAILGYVANTRDYKIVSYLLWLISNTAWCIYNATQGELELAIMFGVYDMFCIYGIHIVRKRIYN